MKSLARILLVDDDVTLADLTSEYLQTQGFGVVVKNNATDGLSTFVDEGADVCILDIRMPVKDGFSLAQEIRELDPLVPIIFLTGQSEKEQRIKGFELGADDYVVKPFSMQELALRIKALLKRSGKLKERTQFTLGNFDFDSNTRSLRLSSDEARLSDAEAKLLWLFCTQPNRLVTRDLALREVWDDVDHLKTRSLNVYINKLRKRLAGDPRVEIINVYGTGYQLVIARDPD